MKIGRYAEKTLLKSRLFLSLLSDPMKFALFNDHEFMNDKFKFYLMPLVAYILIRLMIFLSYPLDYVPIYDASSYLQFSHSSALEPDFYYQRSFFYPLFLKLLGQNMQLVFCVQWAISVLAWWLMASFIFKKLSSNHKKLAWFLGSLILLSSCSLKVSQWDALILSESLTLSFLVLIMYLFFRLMDEKFENKKLGLILVGVILVFTYLRDTNAYFVLGLVPLYIYLFFRDRKMLLIGLILISVSAFALNNFTANQGRRWAAPFGDALTSRLAYYPELIDYFLQKGMPKEGIDILEQIKISHEKENTYEGNYMMTNRGKYQNTATAKWFKENAKQVYTLYLITHPIYLISPILPGHGKNNLWASLKALYDPLRGYTIDYYKGKKPFFIEVLKVGTFVLEGIISLLWILALVLVLSRKKQWNKSALQASGYFFLVSIPLFLIIWHAGGMEYGRHVLIITTVMTLSIFFTMAYSLES